MSESNQPRTDAAAEEPISRTGADGATSPWMDKPARKRLSLPLLAAVWFSLVLVALLAGLFFGVLPLPTGGGPESAAGSPTPTTAAPAAVAPTDGQPQPPHPPEAASLQKAEDAYRTRAYELAETRYRRLLAASQATPANAVVGDFFRFRIARCLARQGKIDQAADLLERVALSDSPILQAVASYDLTVLEYLRGDYLPARRRAYVALAALAAVDTPVPINSDSDYLIARCLRDRVLSYYQAPLEVPLAARWQDANAFAGLEADELDALLNAGRGLTGRALLGPEVRELPRADGRRWFSATCRQAPLEELLQRLAVKSGLEVRWASVTPPARRRAVTARFNRQGAQRIFEVACGMVGFVARFTGRQVIIHDPHSGQSLSAQRALLQKETVSTWRRFFLRHPRDERLAEGHFGLAAIYECCAEDSWALKEYQLVAARFPADAVAPLAVLRSARLRIRLKDYPGARADLLNLLNRYPHSKSLDEVYLKLGEANLASGLVDEAIDVFRKLYYLEGAAESVKQACLGAARCYRTKGEHGKACTWLDHYFKKLGAGRSGQEVAGAYLMLADSLAAQNDLAGGAKALHLALRARPTAVQRTRALLDLALVQSRREYYSSAVTALMKVDPRILRPPQRCRYLVTTAKVYRRMGLADKAALLLRREFAGVSNEQLRLEMGMEMVRCHEAEGEWAAARSLLTSMLGGLSSTPAATAAAGKLAEVYLREDKPAQSVAIGRELLKSDSLGAAARRAVLETLGRAYASRGDYQRAAIALSGIQEK